MPLIATQSTWAATTLDIVITRLFKAERNRLAKNRFSIVKENQKLMNGIDGFIYQGRVFSELDPSIQAKGTKGNLALSLVPQMEEYLKDERKIDYEQGRVKQALGLLIVDCTNMQDMRDVFPDCLVDTIPELSKLNRTREEAYNLLDKPRQYKQYMKLRPLIEMYSVSKLFY